MTWIRKTWGYILATFAALGAALSIAWLVRKNTARSKPRHHDHETERRRTEIVRAELKEAELEKLSLRNEKRLSQRIKAVREMDADAVAARFLEIYHNRRRDDAAEQEAHAQP